MSFDSQSYRYQYLWTMTSIFLVIIYIAHNCVSPFFSLYLKYLNFSVVEMGTIRGIQAWTAMIVPLYVLLTKQFHRPSQKRVIISVPIFISIVMCIALIYVPPQGTPLNVTHCKEKQEITNRTRLSNNLVNSKSVSSESTHHSIDNTLILTEDTSRRKSTEEHMTTLGDNLKILASDVTYAPVYRNTIIEETDIRDPKSSHNIKNNFLINYSGLHNNSSNSESFVPERDMNDHTLIHNTKAPELVQRNEYSLKTLKTDVPFHFNIKHNRLSTDKIVEYVPHDLETESVTSSEPIEMVSQNTNINIENTYGNLAIMNNPNERVDHSYNTQNKVPMLETLPHHNAIEQINNKAMDIEASVTNNYEKMTLPTEYSYDSRKLVDQIKQSDLLLLDNEESNKNMPNTLLFHRKKPLARENVKQTDNLNNYSFNQKTPFLNQKTENNIGQGRQQSKHQALERLTKVFFNNNKEDMQNVIQHAKDLENKITPSHQEQYTLPGYNKAERHGGRKMQYIKNNSGHTRHVLPSWISRPTRQAAPNEIKIQELSSKSVCNKTVKKSTHMIKQSKSRSSVIENSTSQSYILESIVSNSKPHKLFSQKSQVGIHAKTDNNTYKVQNFQIRNRNKGFSTSDLGENSLPLSNKNMKKNLSHHRHYSVAKHNKKYLPNNSGDHIIHDLNENDIMTKNVSFSTNGNKNKVASLPLVDSNSQETKHSIHRQKVLRSRNKRSDLPKDSKHKSRNLKSVNTEKYITTIQQRDSSMINQNDYISAISLSDKPWRLFSNDTWSQVFLTVLLLASLYEVCCFVVKPVVKMFWKQQFAEEEEDSDPEATLRLWSLLAWGSIGCPIIAVLSVISRCPYQPTFHLTLSAILLLVALLLAVFVLPLSPGYNLQFRKRKPSKPQHMTDNADDQEGNMFTRFGHGLSAVITGFNTACCLEFIFWYIDALQGFSYNYEFLYCAYYAVSSLVQIPVDKSLNRWRQRKTIEIKEDVDSWEEEEYISISPLCENMQGFMPSLGQALLAAQLALLLLLPSPYVLLLEGILKGCSDALLETTQSSLGWPLGYGLGCFIGGLVAGAWGVSSLFWTAATAMFAWALGCALYHGFVIYVWRRQNRPYNRLLLEEHLMEEPGGEDDDDWLEKALEREESQHSLLEKQA